MRLVWPWLRHILAATYNRPGYEIVDHYTYALNGDGDLMEGVSQEAASLPNILTRASPVPSSVSTASASNAGLGRNPSATALRDFCSLAVNARKPMLNAQPQLRQNRVRQVRR